MSNIDEKTKLFIEHWFKFLEWLIILVALVTAYEFTNNFVLLVLSFISATAILIYFSQPIWYRLVDHQEIFSKKWWTRYCIYLVIQFTLGVIGLLIVKYLVVASIS